MKNATLESILGRPVTFYGVRFVRISNYSVPLALNRIFTSTGRLLSVVPLKQGLFVILINIFSWESE